MTIALTQEQEVKLKELLDAGQFESPEQFIAYSLASLEEDKETTVWFKSAVNKGLKSLDQGHYSQRTTSELVTEAERRLSTRS